MLTTLRVTGMTCNHCVNHVDGALRGVAGVSAVEVELASGLAKVVHDDTASVPAMLAAIDDAGYTAVLSPVTPVR